MEPDERKRPDAAGVTAVVIGAATVVAVARVGVDAARRKTVVFMPDLWETLLGAQAAGLGRQLVGAWSRLGLYHPGPMWFWWSAPFVRLADGHPSGLAAAAATLAAVALAATFLAVRSATDGAGALVAAAVLAVGVGQLSTPGLAVPWNPTIVILPVTAGLVCVAVVAVTGSTWPAVAAVLFGTLVAQAHLGTLVLGGAIAVGALVAWRMGDRRTTTSPPRWHGSLLLVAALLPWAPVLVDQVTGVGNAATVARYVATGDVDQRFPSEPTGPSADLSVPAALQQLASIGSLAQEHTAIWAGVDLGAGQRHQPSPASTVVALGLFGVAVAAARPERWRRRSTHLLGSWICRAGLVGAAIQVVAVVKVRHEFRPYLVAGAAGVGLALWIGVGLVALHAARKAPWTRALPPARRTLLRRVGTGAVALGAVVAIAGFDGRMEGYRYEQPGDAATLARVTDAIGTGGAVVRVPNAGALQPALALTARLEADGTHLAARGRYRSHFSDVQRQTSATDAERDLWLVPDGTAPPAGCTDLGRYQGAAVCTTDRP